MACNCEYCIMCENCNHTADAHMAGDGQCYSCPCAQFNNKICDAWDKLPLIERQQTSFKIFADKFTEGELK